MNMADVADSAHAARDALAKLASAVRQLPAPKFNLGRSVALLEQLAAWASYERDTGFAEGKTLQTALKTGLKCGLDGREAPRRQQGPKTPVPETPLSDTRVDSAHTSLKEIAKRLGQRGGKSRSPEKIAAAKANIRRLNKKRWGSGARKRSRMEKRR